MTLQHLQTTRQALRELLRRYDAITPTCQHCLSFASGRCEQFDATPPPEFITTPEACEHWSYDHIPF
jgi:hypothetical protein